jgi:hypothetical protein
VAQNTLDKIRASNISNTIVSDFYSNPKEWVLAKQFSAYDIVLNIVNGKATLNLDASDVVSLIFIEASYEFANGQMEVVRGDMLVYANPLNVSGPNPCSITMVDDTTTYEIGFNVTWMGEKIQENVRLNCTGVTPSTSITTNGIAKGMRIGPHQLFYQDESSECTTIDERTLSIDVSSVTGYTYNCSRKFDWIAMQPEENANNFYFKVSQGNPAWADGDISSLASVSSYLFDGFNDVDPVWPLLPCKGYYYIGEDCLLLENRIVNVFPNFDCSVENAKIIPQSSKWVNGRVSFSQTPININVGNPPLGETVDMVTSYRDQNGKMFIGSGTVKDPECDVEHGGVKSFPPKFLYKEPLGIKTYLETKNGVFNRDILVPANVVSVITWKDDFLKETFTFNRGTPQETTMPYPFPIVSFATGIGSVKNSFPIDAPPRDPRCPPYGWLVITSSPEISLSNYSAKVGLFRTSIANVNSVSHTHSCEVDSYGNGLTDATISLSTVDTINHIHTISNFVVDSTITHSHTLQSVAITQIQPTTNRTDDISINAYVPYDPTGASPQSCFDPSYYPYPEGNNRLMYDTLTLPIGLPTAPSLQLRYSAENKVSSPEPIITASQSQPGASFLVAEYPGDTENGFDIKASVWISEYRTWNEATSSYDYHPPVLVPDGTRVTFSLDCYLPKKSASEQSSIKIVAPDIANEYLKIKVNMVSSINGMLITGKQDISLVSMLQWLPDITPLVSSPTNNLAVFSNALSKVETIGASQLFDALVLASKRIIDFGTSNSAIQNYNKLIVLLSDGDENSSQSSLQQAETSINSINSNSKTPISCIKLGNGCSSDEIMLLKLSNDFNGTFNKINNSTTSDIDSVLQQILTSEKTNINSGTYNIILKSDSQSLPFSAGFKNGVSVPVGASIIYRVRTSSDGNIWNPWSSWLTWSDLQTYELSTNNLSLYYNYDVKFIGNSSFESPTISQGLELTYLKASETTVFFQPVSLNISDLEYLSSVLISPQGYLPKTSTLNFGISQATSLDVLDYLNGGRTILGNQQEILLTRYNEPMTTKNYKTYTAKNGRWSNSSQVNVYSFSKGSTNAILVDPSTYISNGNKGTISFLIPQNPNNNFILCVDVDPSFRFLCKIVNYGLETVTLNHISLIYNIMKRIPVGSDGNIIHRTIDQRI